MKRKLESDEEKNVKNANNGRNVRRKLSYEDENNIKVVNEEVSQETKISHVSEMSWFDYAPGAFEFGIKELEEDISFLNKSIESSTDVSVASADYNSRNEVINSAINCLPEGDTKALYIQKQQEMNKLHNNKIKQLCMQSPKALQQRMEDYVKEHKKEPLTLTILAFRAFINNNPKEDEIKLVDSIYIKSDSELTNTPYKSCVSFIFEKTERYHDSQSDTADIMGQYNDNDAMEL